MEHPQGEHRLGLHIDAVLIEAGVDEHRRQGVVGGDRARFVDLQDDGLGAFGTEAQRRDGQASGQPRLQGDDQPVVALRLAVCST